jgi:hypothetical protein
MLLHTSLLHPFAACPMPVHIDLQRLDGIYQCQPVRGVSTREECHCSHACTSFKRNEGVKLNDILECKILSKPEHRTPPTLYLCSP